MLALDSLIENARSGNANFDKFVSIGASITEAKKDIPKGLWYKSPTGKIVDTYYEYNRFVFLNIR